MERLEERTPASTTLDVLLSGLWLGGAAGLVTLTGAEDADAMTSAVPLTDAPALFEPATAGVSLPALAEAMLTAASEEPRAADSMAAPIAGLGEQPLGVLWPEFASAEADAPETATPPSSRPPRSPRAAPARLRSTFPSIARHWCHSPRSARRP